MPLIKGKHVNKDRGVLRKINVLHLFHVKMEKGVPIKLRGQKLIQFSKGDTSQRERATKEKIISTPMPHKKWRHVNKDKGVLRKIKVSHPSHVKKEKGVLRKWIC